MLGTNKLTNNYSTSFCCNLILNDNGFISFDKTIPYQTIMLKLLNIKRVWRQLLWMKLGQIPFIFHEKYSRNPQHNTTIVLGLLNVSNIQHYSWAWSAKHYKSCVLPFIDILISLMKVKILLLEEVIYFLFPRLISMAFSVDSILASFSFWAFCSSIRSSISVFFRLSTLLFIICSQILTIKFN